MAGLLTEYLEDGFQRQCPDGWTCKRERQILSRKTAALLGYSPRADVVMEDGRSGRRIWVEFEISRADPVANHAKFATAQHLGHLQPNDVFLSMMSAHVARGRRNLASNMVSVMRRMGLEAFQTVLLPQVDASGIFQLNHSEKAWLMKNGPDIKPEVGRVIQVCSPIFENNNHRIHFASDPFEVMLSLRQWNKDVLSAAGRTLWGRRRIQYFAFDPVSMAFAPSKFCAFVPLPRTLSAGEAWIASGRMTMAFYTQLDEVETWFDGRIAWQHLIRNLGFCLKNLQHCPDLGSAFHQWHSHFAGLIKLPDDAPFFCVPPAWYSYGAG
jgi:hypothetical protein